MGRPSGRGVRYTKFTHWTPCAVKVLCQWSISHMSQVLLYAPPEIRIMQASLSFAGSGASNHSRYGMRCLSGLKPGASETSVMAAIWPGWALGIFPLGQIYSRSQAPRVVPTSSSKKAIVCFMTITIMLCEYTKLFSHEEIPLHLLAVFAVISLVAAFLLPTRQ